MKYKLTIESDTQSKLVRYSDDLQELQSVINSYSANVICARIEDLYAKRLVLTKVHIP